MVMELGLLRVLDDIVQLPVSSSSLARRPAVTPASPPLRSDPRNPVDLAVGFTRIATLLLSMPAASGMRPFACEVLTLEVGAIALAAKTLCARSRSSAGSFCGGDLSPPYRRDKGLSGHRDNEEALLTMPRFRRALSRLRRYFLHETRFPDGRLGAPFATRLMSFFLPEGSLLLHRPSDVLPPLTTIARAPASLRSPRRSRVLENAASQWHALGRGASSCLRPACPYSRQLLTSILLVGDSKGKRPTRGTLPPPSSLRQPQSQQAHHIKRLALTAEVYQRREQILRTIANATLANDGNSTPMRRDSNGSRAIKTAECISRRAALFNSR
ncbi:hypothetical protein PSPO01_03537 [Paraphaeosphaeria sporulosa]